MRASALQIYQRQAEPITRVQMKTEDCEVSEHERSAGPGVPPSTFKLNHRNMDVHLGGLQPISRKSVTGGTWFTQVCFYPFAIKSCSEVGTRPLQILVLPYSSLKISTALVCWFSLLTFFPRAPSSSTLTEPRLFWPIAPESVMQNEWADEKILCFDSPVMRTLSFHCEPI